MGCVDLGSVWFGFGGCSVVGEMLSSDSESDPYSDLSTQGLRVSWRFISRPISSLSV